VVLEWVSGGSLDDYLKTEKAKDLTWLEQENLAFDIAKGIHYLHQSQIIHGDLRACNILVDVQINQAKLADFGLAKQRLGNMSMVMTNERMLGVTRWLSPELVQTGKRTWSSDVYSFGLVLWEIMTRKVPFPNINDQYASKDVYSACTEGAFWDHHDIPSNVPAIWKELMQACCQMKAEDRPNMAKVTKQLFESIQMADKNEPVDIKAIEVSILYNALENRAQALEDLEYLFLVSRRMKLMAEQFRSSETSIHLFGCFFSYKKQGGCFEIGKKIMSYLNPLDQGALSQVNQSCSKFFMYFQADTRKESVYVDLIL